MIQIHLISVLILIQNKNLRYFLIHKPFGVLSQFTDSKSRPTLNSLFNFPKDVYPVGRLDFDSEGLLLLSNDKRLTNLLLSPKNNHEKEYAVQVEGIPTSNELKEIETGVFVDGRKTRPAQVFLFPEGDMFLPRNPPIRERKNISTTWIRIILTEGRNRQVRKMTASIGFPTLRLIRIRIGDLLIEDYQSGKVIELSARQIESLYNRK